MGGQRQRWSSSQISQGKELAGGKGESTSTYRAPCDNAQLRAYSSVKRWKCKGMRAEAIPRVSEERAASSAAELFQLPREVSLSFRGTNLADLGDLGTSGCAAG